MNERKNGLRRETNQQHPATGCKKGLRSVFRDILLSGFLLLGSAGALSAQQSSEVILAGFNEVPRVNTTGTAVIKVTLEADTLTVSGAFSDLMGAYRSSGIYYGRLNENGNRLLPMNAEVNEDRQSGTFLPEKNRFVLVPSLKEGLRLGRLYINVTSNTRRQGEIRGQIPIMIAD